jgi:hypothetical protein
LQGKNVASNTALQAGAGVYLDLFKDANATVSSGLSSTIMSYDKNLSNMTYGNGGYFSPQTFFAMSIPLNLSGTNGRFGYQLRTSLGLQHFRQDDAPYFPTSALLQANAVAAAAAAAALNSNNNNDLATFAGSTRTALAYSMGGALEYQLSPQVTLGGTLELANGRDYREWKGGVYMRFARDALANAKVIAPQVARSPYSSDR